MVLAKEKTFTFKDVESVIEGAQSFDHQATMVNLSTITVQDDFTFNINDKLVPDNIKITERGLQSLCSLLRLPYDPFAKKVCSEELFLYNIRELLKKNGEDDITVVMDVKGSEPCIVGFTVTLPDALISMPGIVQHIPFDDDTKIHFMCLNSTQIRLDVIHNINKTFEFKKGHTTAIGYSVMGSVLRPSLYGKIFTMQLVCTNGMVAPRTFGEVVSYGSGDRKYENFFNKLVDDEFGRFNALKDAFKWMNDNTIDTLRFVKYWEMVNRTLKDSDATDSLFKTDPDQRKHFYKDVEDARLKSTELMENPVFDDTLINYYDVFYNVTEHAQTIRPLSRLELTTSIGKFLLDARNN